MTTTFTLRGIDYSVSGHISGPGADHGRDGYIVTRADGRPIRGARMRPGMIQIGLSRTLDRRAEAALIDAQSEQQ